jgi:PAS domain S-box-containing protein
MTIGQGSFRARARARLPAVAVPDGLASLALRYGCAVACIVLAVALRLSLDPVFGNRFAYQLVFLAIVVTARFAGFGPAVAAMLLGGAAVDFFVTPPRWSFGLSGVDEHVGLVLYILIGSGIAVLAGAMHHAQRALRDSNLLLEKRVEERARALVEANEKWRTSEELNRLTVQGVSSHAIFMLDQAGVVTSWNPGAARITGYTADEIVGRHFERLYTPEDAESGAPAREMAAAVAHGYFEVEALRLRKDGARFWATVTLTPISGDARQAIGFVCVIRDITERKVAEAARREAEQRLGFALYRSGIGIWEIHVADNTAVGSLEHAHIFGYESVQSDWSVERFLNHVLPDDLPAVQRQLKDAPTSDADWSFECRIRRVDGQVRWIWVTGMRFCDDAGAVSTLAGIIQDITERKRSAEALEASEVKFRLFAEHAPVALAMFDTQMRYLAVSRRWLSDFGIENSESVIGRSHDDLFPDLPEHWRLAHRRALAGEVIRVDEDRSVLANGTKRCCRWEVRPWYDDGKVGGIILLTEDITERKLASDALREREQLLEIVTGSARVGLVVVGPEYRYLFANNAYAEIFGLSAGDIVGRRVSDLLAAGWSQIQPKLDLALAGERVSYELALPPRNGDPGTRHYAAVYEPRTGDDGERSVVVVVVDISQRKRDEEALHVSEERLRLMVEAVSDHAIFLLDPAGNILNWGRGAEEVYGYTAGEMVGRHYSCLFTPESIAAGLPQRELQMAAPGGRVSVEGWRVRKNGSRLWANGTMAAVFDDAHGVKGYTKITRDLTAKRRNDELLRSVLDHTLDAIVSIDERGTISMVNRAGEELFGRTASEIVGQNVSVLMPDLYRLKHDGYLADYLRTGDAKVIGVGREVQGLRKDGTTFPLELAVTQFYLEDERQFVGILRDVSEKKALEARFRQSQKMEAFGQLAGGVAHDFNNLLAVIMGNLELLRNGNATAERHDFVDRALRATNRGAELTHRLLAYARKQDLDPKRVNLNSLVASLVDLFRRTIGEDIDIVTDLAPDVDGVEVDAGQLENALLNLAVNARDAMPNGGKLTIATRLVKLGAVHAKQHPGAAPGDYEVVSVTDTGCGMPKDVLARAFEPFFTTKEVGKGTGLGLSMVYGFARQSGGYATIQSEVGRGTTVSLHLPRPAGPAAVATEESAPELSPTALGHQVLLVEDDADVRSTVKRQLDALGYRTKTAADGHEAIDYLRLNDDIDLLLTDVVMPGGMNGVDLAAEAQRMRPRLRVLLMSGYAERGGAGERIRAEKMHFLGKPFGRAELQAAIAQTLDGGRA